MAFSRILFPEFPASEGHPSLLAIHEPVWALEFLEPWCTRTTQSEIETVKQLARSLRERGGLILNWFRAKRTVSAGAVEGLNNKAKVITRKSCGFRTFGAVETALYDALGATPEPEFTHEFC